MRLRSVAFVLGVLSAAFGDTYPELKTVPSVDLARYAGKWYEIARYPNRFERKCAADITAEYTLLPDGKVKVVNSCRQSDGRLRQSTGRAVVAGKSSNAKLKVTFFWPFYGDYWIIELDPEYRYAVISEPRRKYLWILSRTPQMDAATYERILRGLQERGFDPSLLIQPLQTRE